MRTPVPSQSCLPPTSWKTGFSILLLDDFCFCFLKKILHGSLVPGSLCWRHFHVFMTHKISHKQSHLWTLHPISKLTLTFLVNPARKTKAEHRAQKHAAPTPSGLSCQEPPHLGFRTPIPQALDGAPSLLTERGRHALQWGGNGEGLPQGRGHSDTSSVTDRRTPKQFNTRSQA